MSARLAATWPRLFDPKHAPTWPALAVGIRERIEQALKLDPEECKTLSRTLAKHSKSIPYLHALAAARPRMDLEGHQAGSVTPEQQAKARAELSVRLEQRPAAQPAPPPGKPRPPAKQASADRPHAPFQLPKPPGPVVTLKKRRGFSSK